MDPRVLKGLLVLPLVACPASPAQPSVQEYVSVAPVRNWPGRPELPEDQEPDHGEGSSESLTYLGMGGYTNTSARPMTIDSSAVGPASSAWLPNNFILVADTRDLFVEPFSPVTLSVGSPQIRPNSKGHVACPAARRLTGLRTGRRG